MNWNETLQADFQEIVLATTRVSKWCFHETFGRFWFLKFEINNFLTWILFMRQRHNLPSTKGQLLMMLPGSSVPAGSVCVCACLLSKDRKQLFSSYLTSKFHFRCFLCVQLKQVAPHRFSFQTFSFNACMANGSAFAMPNILWNNLTDD